MRWTVWVCVLAMGCAAGAEMRPRGKRNSVKIEALDKRITALENGHSAPAATPSAREVELQHRIDALTARLTALESEVARLRQAALAPPSP